MKRKRNLKLIVFICMFCFFGIMIFSFNSVLAAEKEGNPPIAGMKPGEEDKYFNWQFNSPFPKHAIPEFFSSHEWWPEQLQKRTGGRMNIEVVYGGVLTQAGQCLELMGANMFESGMESPSFYPNLLFSASGTIPGLSSPPTDVAKYAKIKSYIWLHPRTVQEVEKMYNCTPILGNSASPFILVSKKNIESTTDLKGLKVRGSGVYATFFGQFGAVPINFPTPEAYEWLQRGMIDVVPFSIAEIPARKLYEVADYAINMGWIAGGGGLFANKDLWDSLPQYIKDIHYQLVTEYPAQYEKDFLPGYEKAREFVWNESGIKIIKPSDELQKAWKDAEKGIVDLWVAKAEEKGIKGAREFADDVLAFVAAVNANPNLKWSPDIYDHDRHPEIYKK